VEPPASNLEDWRGVDIGQIRELLQLSVADRAAEMVRVSNLVIEAQDRVKSAQRMDST
jgi:hypothetical protein